MAASSRLARNLVSLIDRRFLWILLGCYLLAVLLPGGGRWLRDLSLGELRFLGPPAKVTLPMVMLALLLFNAGLAARPVAWAEARRVASLVIAGFVINLIVPVIYVGLTTGLTAFWLDAEEVQSILVGLAIVAAMPISGSSTAWARNVSGDMTVSLCLVGLSTLLSPLTTPWVLWGLGRLAELDNREMLQHVAAEGGQGFLILCIVAPSLLGVLFAWLIGERRLENIKHELKLLNWCNLLLLIYSNASAALPEAIAFPDPDFMLTSLGAAVLLCVLTFATGWGLAKLCRAVPAQRTSVMFALGMNNNGAGMVLASVAMADHPRVMLPIITYNLVQHLVAGGAASLVRKERSCSQADGTSQKNQRPDG